MNEKWVQSFNNSFFFNSIKLYNDSTPLIKKSKVTIYKVSDYMETKHWS